MRLSELLVDAWVALPLDASDLSGALGELLARVARAGIVEEARAEKMAQEMAQGSKGEIVRLSDSILVAMVCMERLDGLSITVGVAPEAFQVGSGVADGGTARAVFLALTPGPLNRVRQDLVAVLGKVFRDPERTARLLKARTVDQIRDLREFMEAEFEPRLVVEDALVPVKYRVYPDTPVSEVVDLMIRRGVRAVPVVGEQYEVLGILTSGDALEYLLQQGGREAEGGARTGASQRPARDFMTRTVLCVSEGQSLAEAGNMMVNRDVEQLPVVREGELVGFVTRDSILRALRGTLASETEETTESEFDE